MNAPEYARKVKGALPFPLTVMSREGGGFTARGFSILVPEKWFDNPGFFARLTIRHEVGHLAFRWILLEKGKDAVFDCLKKIPWWFSKIQYFYYWWGPWRKVKIFLGFSSKLKYKPGDEYYLHFTRQQNECFCDWYAVKLYKEMGREQ